MKTQAARLCWTFLAPTLGLLLAAALAVCAPVPAAAAGKPAPQFELPGRDGRQINLAQYRGQVVMLNFWASWCGPCRQEMPLLDGLYRKYGKLGFVLLGVNVEPDARPADDWLKHTPVTFPVLYDKDSKVSQLYDVSGMPSTVFIDRRGTLRTIHRGYKAGDENEYLSTIQALLREN